MVRCNLAGDPGVVISCDCVKFANYVFCKFQGVSTVKGRNNLASGEYNIIDLFLFPLSISINNLNAGQLINIYTSSILSSCFLVKWEFDVYFIFHVTLETHIQGNTIFLLEVRPCFLTVSAGPSWAVCCCALLWRRVVQDNHQFCYYCWRGKYGL